MKFFGATPPRTPQSGAPKYQFFERFKLEGYFFFEISRYLADKYFDIVWGSPWGGAPQTMSKYLFVKYLLISKKVAL